MFVSISPLLTCHHGFIRQLINHETTTLEQIQHPTTDKHEYNTTRTRPILQDVPFIIITKPQLMSYSAFFHSQASSQHDSDKAKDTCLTFYHHHQTTTYVQIQPPITATHELHTTRTSRTIPDVPCITNRKPQLMYHFRQAQS